MNEEKEYCYICGIIIKKDMINSFIYPSYEFKDGKACFSCGKRQQEKNMNAKGIKK